MPEPDPALVILRRALLGERERGYEDATVKGGLDRLLQRLVSERRLLPGSPLARAVRDLAEIGYATLSHAGREHWIGSLLKLLNEPASRPAADAAPAPRPQRLTPPAHRSTARPPKACAAATLDSPVTVLPGVSTGVAAKLAVLRIKTIRDLLFHFPHRYNDFSRIAPISGLQPGAIQTLVASVWAASEKSFGRSRRGTEVIVGDATGNLRVTFFNQPYLARTFQTGVPVVLSGRVSVFQGHRQMDSPEWELLDSDDLAQSVHTGRLTPVYPLTAGLSARSMRRIAHAALDACVEMLPDPLPPEVRARLALPALHDAVRSLHYPETEAAAEVARRRLAFDELFVLQLAVLRARGQRRVRGRAQPLQLPERVRNGFLQSLPFTLTLAQERATDELLADLAGSVPAARLLQGDVGSGKTVVAALALLAAVASGRQGLLMAPTEILAEQHHRTLCRIFDTRAGFDGMQESRPPYLERALRIALLHGGMGARARTDTQRQLAEGKVDIAVGTQALIQEGIEVQHLGLAVVDEQHRFGVMQRAALRDKGGDAHLLVMTATPIPRTLALTLYGDLDVSVIDELPAGRLPVRTKLVRSEQRDQAYAFLHKQIATGRQAFVICPLVAESEKLEVRAATEEYERLRTLPVFADLNISLLHGRMRPSEKEAVMQAFARRESDILVSTAVVEVGIDIPNATVILIEGADRFGLAQLHQFRGRVGRSSEQSYCLLLADNPSVEAIERLQLLETIQDGFSLAEADLRLRGPGEYFGTRQSGLPELRVARLTDTDVLQQARAAAVALLERDPALADASVCEIRERVERLRRDGGEVN